MLHEQAWLRRPPGTNALQARQRRMAGNAFLHRLQTSMHRVPGKDAPTSLPPCNARRFWAKRLLFDLNP
jgi:hypothetical protein